MRLRDIVRMQLPLNVDETFIGGVAGCPDDYQGLFESPHGLTKKPYCGVDCCKDCWDQEYCPAEDCISCDNIDCILHPGDGDD